jgi:hypothetical protein
MSDLLTDKEIKQIDEDLTREKVKSVKLKIKRILDQFKFDKAFEHSHDHSNLCILRYYLNNHRIKTCKKEYEI